MDRVTQGAVEKIVRRNAPDAVHVATAAISPGIEEMHTFDDRLLALNGAIDKADGTKLKICKPDAGAPAAPLLEAMHDSKK